MARPCRLHLIRRTDRSAIHSISRGWSRRGAGLNVVAMNAAGNVVTSSVNVSLPSAIPLAITQETPTPGDGDVGVTYRPEIFFSRPIDTTTLNSTNFFASDTAGNVLPATIVPANDGTFALRCSSIRQCRARARLR